MVDLAARLAAAQGHVTKLLEAALQATPPLPFELSEDQVVELVYEMRVMRESADRIQRLLAPLAAGDVHPAAPVTSPSATVITRGTRAWSGSLRRVVMKCRRCGSMHQTILFPF